MGRSNQPGVITALTCLGIVLACGVRSWAEHSGDNTSIAQDRLRRLAVAVNIYINANHGHPPTEPHLLFPDYVDDPVVFWHPGDTDAPPTTIDNSQPNAANSAKISFEWAAINPNRQLDQVLVFDNSPLNNDGQFVIFATYDMSVETEPPSSITPPPTIRIAQNHLRRLGRALIEYSWENEDLFPSDPLSLWDETYLLSTRSFWNPGDDQPLPRRLTNSILDFPDSVQVSFQFLVSGGDSKELVESAPLVQDITADNNDGLGINVARWPWGDVEFELAGAANDINHDCRVTLEDWAIFVGCMCGPRTLLPLNACYVFDADRNHNGDLYDFARFTRDFTGVSQSLPNCEP